MNKLLVALLTCLCLFLLPVQAAVIKLAANFDCAQANAGAGTCGAGGSGTGIGRMTFDTVSNLLSWEVSHSGLSSSVTAAHFHGPASATQNAGIQVGIGTINPAVGSAVISAAQATDLLAGLWYINIHSANFPGGEIRGQVNIAPECDLQLNQSTYVDGETVTAEVFRLVNFSTTSVGLELKIWLTVPGISPIPVVNLGSDGGFELPPGTDIDLGPIPLLPVSAALPRGGYEFSCRMIDPVTGELRAQDRNFFGVTTAVPPAPTAETAGDLVITEIMANPSAVSDQDGEWFEIYNPTATEFDLQGLVISDDGTNSFQINSTLIISAGGFVILGANGDTGANGGVNVNFVFGNFVLSNINDQIVISNGLTVIDRVDYSSPQSGRAASLDPDFFDAISNDFGDNWCLATDVLPEGDFGTPGTINPACN